VTPGERPAVLVVGPPRYVGPLGVMRSLGRQGVRVFGARHRARSAPSSSRYCAGTLPVGNDGRPWDDGARTLAELLEAGRRLGAGTILMAGSDEWAVFVARHAAELAPWFRFPIVPLDLVEELAAKDGLYRLATSHGLPTPRIVFPASREQAMAEASRLLYPVMLKPVRSRPDVLDKAVAGDARQLVEAYGRMEESPDAPNVMFQEYIPGNDSDVWIFNGYFNAESRCLAAFTGVKVRQHPAKMGIASLGELRQNRAVIDSTCDFMRSVGYRGIVDIGYRFDIRDGEYKVLDINPRLGGAFRMFVDEHGMDVARALYLDLTGRDVPAIAPRDGRRWINETADLVASTHYHRLEGLSLAGWIRSLSKVREGATWALDDPFPFAVAMTLLIRETLAAKWQRFRRRARAAARRIPAAAGSGEKAA
jgi:D-aspartate ligase